MNIAKPAAAAIAVAAIAAAPADLSAYTEPVYLFETSGTGTNLASTLTVSVTENGVTTAKSYGEISPTSGTIVKRGTGFLLPDSRLGDFTGEIVVEEGAWLVTGPGELGKSTYDSKAKVVVTNGGGSVVFDVPPTLDAHFYQNFWLAGDGYDGLGALCILNMGNPSGSYYTKVFHASTWILTGDATLCLGDVDAAGTTKVYTYYQSLYLEGHKLSVRNLEGSSGGRVLSTTYLGLYPKTGGQLDFDGVDFELYSPSALQGDSGNVLTFSDPAGKSAWLRLTSGSILIPWTLRLCDAAIYSNKGVPGTTNVAAWAGPVELLDGRNALDGVNSTSFSFLGPLTGAGGLEVPTAREISLVGGGSFEGEFVLNSKATNAEPRTAEGALRVFWPGALPATSKGATLYDSDLKLMYGDAYDLPALAFDIAGGMTNSFSGGTNGIVAALSVRGGGTLDMTAPLAVTGVTEIAAGSTLRIPCDRAGLNFGWRIQ